MKNLTLLALALFSLVNVSPTPARAEECWSGWYGSYLGCCSFYRGMTNILNDKIIELDILKAKLPGMINEAMQTQDAARMQQEDSLVRWKVAKKSFEMHEQQHAWFETALGEIREIRKSWDSMSQESLYPLVALGLIFDHGVKTVQTSALEEIKFQIPQGKEFEQELGLALLYNKTKRMIEQSQTDPDAVWDSELDEEDENRPLIIVLAERMAENASTLRARALSFNASFAELEANFLVKAHSEKIQKESLEPVVVTAKADYDQDLATFTAATAELTRLQNLDIEGMKAVLNMKKGSCYTFWHKWDDSDDEGHQSRCRDNWHDDDTEGSQCEE